MLVSQSGAQDSVVGWEVEGRKDHSFGKLLLSYRANHTSAVLNSVFLARRSAHNVPVLSFPTVTGLKSKG